MSPLSYLAGTIGIFPLLLIITGCIDLKPQSDPTRFFLLMNASPTALNNDEKGLSIGLKRIELADYLKSPKMVVRRGDHEIVYSSFNRWGEDLDVAIGRFLAKSLASHTQIESVSIFPWKEPVEHDYTILVRVEQFEGSDKSKAILYAQWEIYEANMGEKVHVGTTVADPTWDGKDYAALARTLSEALEGLSHDLTTALEDVR